MNIRTWQGPLLSGLALLLTGVTFLFLEHVFYHYVDEQGVLHESWFLPLGVLALFLGALLLFYAGAGKFVVLVKMRRGQ